MTIIHNYKVFEKIGQGQFGVVYRGIHEKRGDPVAIKCEPHNTPFKLLKRETTILNLVYHKEYTPPILWFGKHKIYQVLVLPYYSMSLETYVIQRLFPAKSPQPIVQQLYCNIIEILNYIHSRSVVHRDIKPQNLMIHNNRLILIDFGLAILHDPTNNSEPREHITGNARFASIHTHCGAPISPTDEIISAFYIYIWMVYGQLPWSHPPPLPPTPHPVTHVLHPLNVYIEECKQWEYMHTWLETVLPLDDGNAEYWKNTMLQEYQTLLVSSR